MVLVLVVEALALALVAVAQANLLAVVWQQKKDEVIEERNVRRNKWMLQL